jgi:hypothetical protein
MLMLVLGGTLIMDWRWTLNHRADLSLPTTVEHEIVPRQSILPLEMGNKSCASSLSLADVLKILDYSSFYVVFDFSLLFPSAAGFF